jgi:hypothetical protein
MSRRTLDIHYVDVLLMLGLARIFLWLRPSRFSVRSLFAHITIAIGGLLHPRPDPAFEQVLRTAFAEFDRELDLILGDRDPGRRPGL